MPRKYKKKLVRKRRAPNKIKETNAGNTLYRFFIRPFLDRFSLLEEQLEFKEGMEAFFGYPGRRLAWCKAKEGFTLPGLMWADPSIPHKLIPGTGRRYVPKGAGVIVRLEEGRKDYNEIEFDEQVFVLTDAHLAIVNPYLEIVA
jgi:hypothetical protein